MAFSNPVVGGENGELIRAAIQSPNYVPGVTGWTINRDGSAEFSNVTIRFELGTGSIVVGPAGSPQVVITSNATEGRIEFPTNSPNEDGVAAIYSSIELPGQAAERLTLNLESPSVNGAGNTAEINMNSAAENGATQQRISMSLNGLSGLQAMEVNATSNDHFNAVHNFDSEVFVMDAPFTTGNYPVRVKAGLIGTGSTQTTIGTASATAITNAAFTTRLFTGVAYRMDVQVPLSADVTSSAAGTQRVTWTLWNGAVGSGTRVGALSRKFKVGAVGAMQEDVNLTFVWRNTELPDEGNFTLRLAAQHTQGTDTLEATYSDQLSMILYRIGDPDVITNM